MRNVRNAGERYAFAPCMQGVRSAALGRMGTYNDREGTAGLAPDGKTPFLDAFEALEGRATYAEALAEGIVRSWLETEPVLYEGEIIVGTPRATRPLVEHFSWGLQYNPEILSHPAYAAKRAETALRVARQSSRLFPLGRRHIDEAGEAIFGAEAYASMEGALWMVGGYQGHTVPNYPKLLRLGIEGTLGEISAAASGTADPEKLALYRALTRLLEGFSAYIERYAQAASRRAEAALDAQDRARLLCVAENCRAISRRAPETLYQAAQLTWFYALWDWVDCMGRMDAYLWPFYRRAPEKSCFPPDDIMASIVLKMMEHGVHNITLGGLIPESGADATNDMTFLILQIVRSLHQTHPRLSIRLHADSPPELLALAVAMWSEGMCDPTVVSDETVIKGLCGYGVPLKDARDYSMLGCQEIEIPGRSNFGCEDGLLNLAKVFEYTINDGRCRVSGHQIGLRTGYLSDYDSTDALYAAYMRQIRHLLPHFIKLCNLGVEIRGANLSKLVKMPFTEDCVARGLNPDAGGARYNYGVIETAGASAVADAFTAIEHLVFQCRRLTMTDVQEAIDANFEGHEKTRLLLQNAAPKYGNDEPLADALACRVVNDFWQEIGKYRSVRGDVFMGACSLLTAGVAYGAHTWAMPDGRVWGEPLGNTIGPRPGADKSGVTAMLNSVAKLPLHLGVGGTTVNVTLPRSLLKTEALRADIQALVRAYLLGGGQMAQMTTASLEDMQDAQRHPERHGDLLVRVGGFSIHFVELGEAVQNEIMSRY